MLLRHRRRGEKRSAGVRAGRRGDGVAEGKEKAWMLRGWEEAAKPPNCCWAVDKP